MSNIEYNTFKDQHKEFLIKFMEWYWKSMQNTDPNFIIGFRSDISIADYEFIYSLWRNGVDTYDSSMQKRLNDLRGKYIANN
jgi:hypothetical protein